MSPLDLKSHSNNGKDPDEKKFNQVKNLNFAELDYLGLFKGKGVVFVQDQVIDLDFLYLIRLLCTMFGRTKIL